VNYRHGLPQVMNHRDPVMTAHLPGSQPGSVVKTGTDRHGEVPRPAQPRA
jgi:hypothetical protein